MSNQQSFIGEIIEITARKCGGLQPSVKIGSRYTVKAEDRAKDGSLTLICPSTATKCGQVRINERRFSWKVITAKDLDRERLDKQTSDIMRTFSRDEKLQIAIVPLLYNQMAWIYAEKALDLARADRVEILKKLSRTVREKRREYEKIISKRLDNRHIKVIETGASDFLKRFSTDFFLLELALKEQLANKCPGYPFRDLRTNAILSKVMLLMSDRQNILADEMIESRLGYCKRKKRMPVLDSLYTCMEAMGGDNGRVKLSDERIQLSMKVIANKMRQVEFNFID